MEKKSEEKETFLIAGRFCPECEEMIAPADLEMFHTCPYCNHQFPDNAELEEFVLSQLLHRWMVNNCQRFLR
ncbi:MAG: hypothetical protein IKD23_00005 [Lentisphaeria bacterium]|nr:hypothetical protein [Lentisphaerota bacterium]MBR2624759.1 hypothetical protein [Lentisphaeria bacterium]